MEEGRPVLAGYLVKKQYNAGNLTAFVPTAQKYIRN
jgi:hypothetical protein